MVARTHGQSAKFAHGRADDYFQGEIQILDHFSHHGGLLKILRAKNGHAGLDNVEQLGQDSRHAAEMRWTHGAFHSLRKSFLRDISAETLGIHFTVRGRKQDIHARVRAEFFVAREIARIGGQVLMGRELGRIDIEADDDLALAADSPAAAFDEAGVALMQKTHGRHQRDGDLQRLPRFGVALHGGNGLNNSHHEYVEENDGRGNANFCLGDSPLSGLCPIDGVGPGN